MFNFLDSLNVEESIIVCEKEVHMLLQEYYSKKLIPIKVMDYKTFIDYYLGTIDEEVYVSLLKNGLSYELGKVFVSHFLSYYYLKINDEKLDNVKQFILNHLKINKYIQNELKQKHVFFINPDITNDLVKTVINISNNIEIKLINKVNQANIKVLKETNIDFEVDKMLNILTNNLLTEQEDIYLYLSTSEYLPIVLSKLNLFNLRYTTDIQTSLMDLTIGKELLNYINNHYNKRDDLFSLFKESIDYIKNKYLISDDTLEQIYKSLSNFTKYNVEDYHLIKDILIDNLKNIKVVNEVIKTNLNLLTKLPKDFNNKCIYFLGANQNNFPTLVKNRDYFTDNIRKEYNLLTSVEKNEFNQNRLINNLYSTSSAYISYNVSNEKIKSNILDKLEHVLLDNNIDNNTSKEVDDLLYSKALDKYYIYKEFSNDLSNLYDKDVKARYNSYDNQYTGKIKISKDLSLSATTLKEYNECNYKYYLNRILKINNSSDKSSALIGDYFHLMLKKLFTNQLILEDLKEETLKYIDESPYLENNAQTEYYYLKYSTYVEKAYQYISAIYHEGDIYKIEYEKELNGLLNTLIDGKSYNDTVKGIVDKYFIYKIGEAYKVLIVDYKTSDIKTNLDLLPYGLDVQLPFYFYLLSKDELKYELIGSFLQQVMPKSPYKMEKDKTVDEQYEKNILYRGYSVIGNNEKVIVKNKSKTITLEETKEIIEQVDELLKKTFKNIHQGEFSINPKFVDNGKIFACTYCSYASICYKRVTNYVVINTKEEGGENNED